jgi:predicted PurR-regulated permease PerM
VGPPNLLAQIGGTLAGWIKGQFKVAGVLTLIYAVGFALAGVPLWPMMAVICGASNVVPIFGAPVGLAITAFVTWFGTDDLYVLVWMLVVWVAAQIVESFYLTPRLVGRSVRLPPFAVFVVVLAGGALFGFVGVLLAVPVVAVLMVIWRWTQRSRNARPL